MAATVSVLIAVVIVSLAGAGNVSPATSFPFGQQSPSGCSEYGTTIYQNVSYWFCDTWNESSPFLDERGNLTFADVSFSLRLIATYAGCGIFQITGVEVDRAVWVIGIGSKVAITCEEVTTPILSADGVFGAQLVIGQGITLLVRVSPN